MWGILVKEVRVKLNLFNEFQLEGDEGGPCCERGGSSEGYGLPHSSGADGEGDYQFC